MRGFSEPRVCACVGGGQEGLCVKFEEACERGGVAQVARGANFVEACFNKKGMVFKECSCLEIHVELEHSQRGWV